MGVFKSHLDLGCASHDFLLRIFMLESELSFGDFVGKCCKMHTRVFADMFAKQSQKRPVVLAKG